MKCVIWLAALCAAESQNHWAALCAAHEIAGQKSESQILERVRGVEPLSQLWKSWVIAVIRYPHTFGVSRFELELPPAADSPLAENPPSPRQIFTFGLLGFEPRLNPPKGLVLPLHYSPVKFGGARRTRATVTLYPDNPPPSLF